jgi:hypothetical protein
MSSSSSNSNNNFVRALEDELEMTKNFFVLDEYESSRDIADKSVKVTRPYLIMFNVMVNRRPQQIDLDGIISGLSRDKFEKHVYPNNGIGIQVRKVIGRSGRFKKVYTYTAEYGQKGNSENIFVLDFFIDVMLGSEVVHAIVSLFKNGKMMLRGGYLSQRLENVDNSLYFDAQPEMIRSYIVDTFTNRAQFLRDGFKYDNIVGEFRVNRGFDFMTMIEASARSNYNIRYTPETSPLLKIKMDDFQYTLSPRGIIQMRKLKDQNDLNASYKRAIEFLNDAVSYERSQRPNAQGRIKRILKMLEPGFEQRRKRSPQNLKNKPAPNVTRRGTSCPMNRRPTPYSMQGKCSKNGCYVKPNPQGQPCCYKIPKSTNYSKDKVQKAFEKANIKVPNIVRKVFNFGDNTNNKLNNTTNQGADIVVKMNNNLGLKIGSRQCSRYSKTALVNIAHRLGIVLPRVTTKPMLCNLIANHARNVSITNSKSGALAVKFKVRDKVYVVTGNSVNTLRIGERVAKTYPKANLIQFAHKLGVRTVESMPTLAICKNILDELQRRKKNVSTENVMAMLRIRKANIKQNIQKMYGTRDVPNLNAKVNAMYNIVHQSLEKNVGYGTVTMTNNIINANSIAKIKKKYLNSTNK